MDKKRSGAKHLVRRLAVRGPEEELREDAAAVPVHGPLLAGAVDAQEFLGGRCLRCSSKNLPFEEP